MTYWWFLTLATHAGHSTNEALISNIYHLINCTSDQSQTEDELLMNSVKLCSFWVLQGPSIRYHEMLLSNPRLTCVSIAVAAVHLLVNLVYILTCSYTFKLLGTVNWSRRVPGPQKPSPRIGNQFLLTELQGF